MFVLEAMSFSQLAPPNRPGYAGRRMLSRTALGTLGLVCAMVGAGCSQQSADTSDQSAGGANPKASAPVAVVAPSGPRWQDLTNEQRVMLRPLAATWDSLASAHKSKWISVAHGVASRPALEQKKMQERMAAWAALTPVERERARLNFAETKKLSPTDRATEWAAYQELSAEEKKRLAEKSKPSPMGAAIALSPVPNDKLTAVPITRRTTQQPEAASISKPQIDPNTLLPKVTPPASSSQSPATPDTATPVDGIAPITIDTVSSN